MTSKKYYAVASGRKPGIYDNWPAAQAQVTGYPGAKFKGFLTREEADAWLKKPTTCQSSVNPPRKTGPSNSDTTPKAVEVTIYTDGSARYNPGPVFLDPPAFGPDGF